MHQVDPIYKIISRLITNNKGLLEWKIWKLLEINRMQQDIATFTITNDARDL